MKIFEKFLKFLEYMKYMTTGIPVNINIFAWNLAKLWVFTDQTHACLSKIFCFHFYAIIALSPYLFLQNSILNWNTHSQVSIAFNQQFTSFLNQRFNTNLKTWFLLSNQLKFHIDRSLRWLANSFIKTQHSR